uniref:MIF4G domain-containing protein n=1 Tax=Mesocestoides corti TaxID=53468 RepID=A0A5K3F641_MESCO
MSRRRSRGAYYEHDDNSITKRGRLDRDTIESLLYRIGLKDTEKIHKDISELCILFCAELEKNPEYYVNVFVSCAKNIPERMPIYTTLLGLVNLKNREFASRVIEVIIRELKDALRTSNFDDVKYLVRFLSNAVNSNVVHPASLLSLYENFAEVTLDVCASSQSRTDWYSYVVLYALPYSAKRLNDHNAAALNAILSTINVYLSKRQTLHVPILRVWDNSDPHPQEDYLTCLWSQITSMKNANWKEHVLWRIYDAFPALRESGQPCEFGQITPPDYDSEIVYPLPQVVFRMFDYTDIYNADEDDESGVLDPQKNTKGTSSSASPTLPGAHTIERFLVDEQIHIILETMHFNRAMCALALLNLQTRAKVALDYMIVEAIFSDIFRLPKPPVRHGNLLFYASLLIQLCNDAVNTMPLVLAQATETLFERLDTMKPVCIARFVEWFSFHLTNYQLKWSWRDWSRALEEPVMSPRRWFISETLRRLVRYSYYENVKQHLPRSFYCLLPPQPAPINPYENASPAQRRVFTRVLDAFHERHSPDGLLDIIRRLASQTGDVFNDSDDDNHRSRSNSRSGSHSDTDNDPMEGKTAERSRVAGRHRHRRGDEKRSRSHSSSSSSFSREMAKEENNNEKGGEGGLTKGSTSERNVSPPRMNEEATKRGDANGDCLVPGVTSRELELFMTALLYRAHKTISHTCSLLNRYSETFKILASTVELQVEALHILQAVWCNQSQMVVAISDYMSRLGMLDPESIVGWAFSPYMSAFCGNLAPSNNVYIRPRMLELHVWECLMRTLVRVGQRIAQITPKLEAAKDRLGARRRKSASDSRSSESCSDSENDDGDLRNKIRRGRRHQRNRRRSRSRSGGGGHSSDSSGRYRRGASPGKVARLEEERGEAVRSQCAVITLLLHRHVRLIALVEEALERGCENDTNVDFNFMGYWLKGRLIQTVLEHQDQLFPYMDNLEELMSDVTPFVRNVFQALRSLYA